tara:strand:- start:121651 stop:122034 length:384 start_codon:yes stop_codon:yes gene_type:complete
MLTNKTAQTQAVQRLKKLMVCNVPFRLQNDVIQSFKKWMFLLDEEERLGVILAPLGKYLAPGVKITEDSIREMIESASLNDVLIAARAAIKSCPLQIMHVQKGRFTKPYQCFVYCTPKGEAYIIRTS